MTTDFTYGGKQIVSGGPFKPNEKDMPNDARTRVDCYADIATIPNPYVGLKITVKVDETNDNKMTDYIVKSLKANSIGIANSLIDEVVRYVDYLGVNTSGSSGEGLTSEQANQLTTAYEHSQSPHITTGDVNTAIQTYINDNISLLKGDKGDKGDTGPQGPRGEQGDTGPKGQDGLTTSIKVGSQTFTQNEGLITLTGIATENFVTTKISEAQLSGGTGSVDLSTYATKEELNNKADRSDIPTKVGQLENDSNYLKSTDTIDADSLNGKKFSDPMTKEEYEVADKDPNTIYLINDDTVIEDIPSYSDIDANKVLAVNRDGTGLTWVNPPSSSGSGLTAEQSNQLTTAYNHSQTAHVKISDIPTKLSQLENDLVLVSDSGKQFKLKISDDGVISAELYVVYGNIIISNNTLSVNESSSNTFTVSLDKAPTNNQVVSLSVNNNNCTLDKTSLTFTNDNYTNQTVSVIGVHDSNSYEDKSSVITLSSDNVTSKTINVTVTNIDVPILQSISAVYTQGSTIVHPSTDLNSLKSKLVVTARYDNNNTIAVTDYVLSGTLTVGTSTITVTYQDKTTTFDVIVSDESVENIVTDGLTLYADARNNVGSVENAIPEKISNATVKFANFASNPSFNSKGVEITGTAIEVVPIIKSLLPDMDNGFTIDIKWYQFVRSMVVLNMQGAIRIFNDYAQFSYVDTSDAKKEMRLLTFGNLINGESVDTYDNLIDESQPVHFIYRYNGNGSVSGWVNGYKIENDAIGTDFKELPSELKADYAKIRINQGSPTDITVGFQFMRVYNKALTDEEVMQNFNA